MDYSGSVTRAATSDPVIPGTTEPSPQPPSSTTNPPVTSTTDPVTSTTANPTTDPSSTTTNDPPPKSTTTPPPSVTTTTPPPPVISTTKEVATSTPIPIVTVTTSGTVVRTFTSTSYSNYITHVATAIPSQGGGGGGSGSTNVGAIAGGVVGGVAAIALIGFIVILLSRRRRSKDRKEASYASETGGGAGGPINPHPFANDYNTYGTPTVISDNNSLPSSRPLSMSTAPSQGIKPRPFVQAYNPAYDDQHQQYAGYDGSQSPPQEHYYNDYNNQAYNTNYNNNAYSHDAYYAHQQEPMIPISTSTTTGLSSTTNNPPLPHGRNVPDENDYDLTRKVSRHVPDEIN